MLDAASGRPEPAGRIRRATARGARVASLPSGGCWAPTKDRWSPPTCHTWRVPLQPPTLPEPRDGLLRVLELVPTSRRYQDLIATKRPRAVSPTPPEARGHPPSHLKPPLETINGYPRSRFIVRFRCTSPLIPRMMWEGARQTVRVP